MKSNIIKRIIIIVVVVAVLFSVYYTNTKRRSDKLSFNKNVDIEIITDEIIEEVDTNDSEPSYVDTGIEEVTSASIDTISGDFDSELSEKHDSNEESQVVSDENLDGFDGTNFVLTSSIVKDILGNHAEYLLTNDCVDVSAYNEYLRSLDYSSADTNNITFQYSGLNDLENICIYVYDMYVNGADFNRESGIIRIEVANSGILDIDKFILFQR